MSSLKKGIGEIVAVGSRTVFLPAGPAARAGDYIACGCPLGTNTLLADGSISIDSSGESITPALGAASLKKINRIFFTFGESQIPLGPKSRFQSDVNLHAETVGYSSGEIIIFSLDDAANSKIRGVVGDDGRVIIPCFLENQKIEIEGVV